MGELEVAARRPRTPEERGEALQQALQSARRLSALVEGLLLLARVDSGHAEQGRAREHAGHLATLAAAPVLAKPFTRSTLEAAISDAMAESSEHPGHANG